MSTLLLLRLLSLKKDKNGADNPSRLDTDQFKVNVERKLVMRVGPITIMGRGSPTFTPPPSLSGSLKELKAALGHKARSYPAVAGDTTRNQCCRPAARERGELTSSSADEEC